MGLNTGNVKSTTGGKVPLSIRNAFKPSTQLEHVTGLKVAVFSRAKVGKTHLAFTCPKPIYGIDTEGSWGLNRNQFDKETQEQVHVSQVLFMADKEKGKVDLVQSLDAAKDAMDVLTDYIKYNDRVGTYLEAMKTAPLVDIVNAVKPDNVKEGTDAYEVLTDVVLYVLEEMVYYASVDLRDDKYVWLKPFPRGTIVLDSGTDIWDWLAIWKDENFTDQRTSRLSWGHANKRYNEFIMMMLFSKWNVYATFKAEAAKTDKGADLKYDNPKWQKKTDYWFDVILEMKNEPEGRVIYFRGDRFGGVTDTLVNPGWDDIQKLLESKKKVKVT